MLSESLPIFLTCRRLLYSNRRCARLFPSPAGHDKQASLKQPQPMLQALLYRVITGVDCRAALYAVPSSPGSQVCLLRPLHVTSFSLRRHIDHMCP